MSAEPRGVGMQNKGALAHLHPQHLASTVVRALIDRTGVDTADVDNVVWGTSSQVSEQSGDLGRMAALDTGFDIKASGVTPIASADRVSRARTSPPPQSWPAWRTWSSPAVPR